LDIPILTKRLKIDRLKDSDAHTMFKYRSDPLISRYQNWEPSHIEEIQTFIAELKNVDIGAPGSWFQLGMYLRESDEMVGDLGIHTQSNNRSQAEIGITLSISFQRRGLATEALTALLKYLFVKLGKHRVYASVDPRNTPSIALLERVGMRKEAHFVESLWFKGEWVDDVIYAMLKSEFSLEVDKLF